MNDAPLQPLHSATSLIQSKLNQFDRVSTDDLLASLLPSQQGSLKVRPDGTILDGHHRIAILRSRGIDVDHLPREIITKSNF
jgi:ParB-like chromosome segregation protein Spo0J